MQDIIRNEDDFKNLCLYLDIKIKKILISSWLEYFLFETTLLQKLKQ